MNRSHLREAASVIKQGGIVAYPTESCYGLGCDPRQHKAVRRLLQVKRRPRAMGLILIAARIQQLCGYLNCAHSESLNRARAVWPGPYTWLMPAQPHVSPWIRGSHERIAVRVTNHPGAAALCQHAKSALVSTSANRYGRPAARSWKAVQREFGNQIDYILEGRLGAMKTPSQIRDAVTNELIRP